MAAWLSGEPVSTSVNVPLDTLFSCQSPGAAIENPAEVLV
jgi:hypothetical protein